MECDYNTNPDSTGEPIPCGRPAVVAFWHWSALAGVRKGVRRIYPRCKVHSSARVREVAQEQGYTIHEV